MNDKFGTKKTTDKYQKKMEYLVDRYKQAKEWNNKQSEGNQLITMKLTKFWAVTTSLPFKMTKKRRGVCRRKAIQTKREAMQALNAAMMLEQKARRRQDRRGKNEEKVDEDRKMFKSALSGVETQRSDHRQPKLQL